MNNMKRLFNEKEVPYEELNKIGISKEQFLDFPRQVIDQLMSGRRSPLLMLDVNGKQKKYQLPAKIAFERGKDGQLHVVTFPINKEIKNSLNLKEEELEKLQNNENIVTTVEKDGKKEKVIVQYDGETRTLMYTPQKDIHIPNAIADKILGQEQKERIREGKPLELDTGDTKVTVGVDLNAKGGFKVVDGDMNEWEKQKLIKWDMATPGITGYWRTNENVWQYEKFQRQEEKQEQEQQRSQGMRMRR